MKIILDTDICKNEGTDPDVALYLLSLLSGCKITLDTFEKARQQRLLKFEQMYDSRYPFPEYVLLNDTGVHVAEGLMAKSKSSNEDRFKALAAKMMEVFPAGSKIGQNGTKHPWRGNVTTIAERLQKFVAKYGDYTDEEFVDAAKRYVADYIGKSTMRILLYFIFKNVKDGEQVVGDRVVGETMRISPLADYLATKENEENIVVNHDWDVRLC